jgi:hypothetical protein
MRLDTMVGKEPQRSSPATSYLEISPLPEIESGSLGCPLFVFQPGAHGMERLQGRKFG